MKKCWCVSMCWTCWLFGQPANWASWMSSILMLHFFANNVKPCMMVLFIELCLFTPLSVTLIVLSNSFNWKMWLIKFEICVTGNCINYIMNILVFLTFTLYSMEIVDMLPDLTTKNSNTDSFWGLCLSKVFNFAWWFSWGIQVHTRFDVLDLVSRSLVCEKHELQVAFF